jgi:hypothetical protein
VVLPVYSTRVALGTTGGTSTWEVLFHVPGDKTFQISAITLVNGGAAGNLLLGSTPGPIPFFEATAVPAGGSSVCELRHIIPPGEFLQVFTYGVIYNYYVSGKLLSSV